MEELKIGSYNEWINSPFPLINSIIKGLQIGKIFVDENSFFIIHKAGFSYLKSKNDGDNSAILDFFLQSKELPNYFHIYDAPSGLIAFCSENSNNVNIKVRKRIQLKFLNTQFSLRNKVPSGFSLSKIDDCKFKNLSVFNLSLENRFWNSEEDFLKNGFGFSVNNELGFPISLCYSACVVDGVAEIDVATLPEHRKKGFARLAVEHFVQYCIETGITPNWDCFEDNYNSLMIAEGIGFEKINTYNFLSIFNKTRKS